MEKVGLGPVSSSVGQRFCLLSSPSNVSTQTETKKKKKENKSAAMMEDEAGRKVVALRWPTETSTSLAGDKVVVDVDIVLGPVLCRPTVCPRNAARRFFDDSKTRSAAPTLPTVPRA